VKNGTDLLYHQVVRCDTKILKSLQLATDDKTSDVPLVGLLGALGGTLGGVVTSSMISFVFPLLMMLSIFCLAWWFGSATLQVPSRNHNRWLRSRRMLVVTRSHKKPTRPPHIPVQTSSPNGCNLNRTCNLDFKFQCSSFATLRQLCSIRGNYFR